MSAETSPAPSVAKPPAAATVTSTANSNTMAAASPLPTTVTHTQKSYRRKYRKIMVNFERQMRQSKTLFEDDQKIQDISQRLAEQNDQLLSLLLELNNHPQVPGRLRYDLRDPTDTSDFKEHTDVDAATTSLRVNRYRVFKGETEQGDYEEHARGLLNTAEFAPQRSYAKLLKHVKLEKAPIEQPQETTSPMAGGFLSRKQEEQYLNSLDLWCNRQATHPRSHAISNLGSKAGEKSIDREREMQLKNPVSVYNWLRKNQPQVFLQDADSDKPKSTTARKSKRESMPKPAKAEPELYDDDGIALESTATKGKRKRDDDGGYRPKGGSARPTKRRKDESGRRSKRASMDISAN